MKLQIADLRGRGSSDEVFPVTHKSGHTLGTAESATMPRRTTSQSSRALEDLYTRSVEGCDDGAGDSQTTNSM